MCEFDLTVDGKIVFRDVIYAKAEDGEVIVRNILGESKEYKNRGIEEVDVNHTRLVLSAI
jgi:predicted RNA-binding protein